jgi:hypothetical protein
MSYQIRWLLHDRVIYDQIWGCQTLEEIQQASKDIEIFLNTGESPVHIVIDSRELQEVPLNLKALRQSTQYLRNPSIGWVIHLNNAQRPILDFLAEMLVSFFQVQYHRTQTVEQAITFLSQKDPSLIWDADAENKIGRVL